MINTERTARMYPRKMRETQPRLSTVLRDVADDESRERISTRDMMEALSSRAGSAMILIFAIPNTIPNIPGVAAILSIPLLYLTFQAMRGVMPALPRVVAERSMARSDFSKMVDRINPLLERAERRLVPRATSLTTAQARRVVNIMAFILAVVMFLPIPGGNMLPAISISLMMLGLIEEDGLWTAIGFLVGILALLVIGGVISVAMSLLLSMLT